MRLGRWDKWVLYSDVHFLVAATEPNTAPFLQCGRLRHFFQPKAFAVKPSCFFLTVRRCRQLYMVNPLKATIHPTIPPSQNEVIQSTATNPPAAWSSV